MAKGTLVVNVKGQIRIRFTNAKNKPIEMAVPGAELSRELKAEKPQYLNGRDVDFDEIGGLPKAVRTVGQPFQGTPPPPPRPAAQPRSQPRGAPAPATQPLAARPPSDFVNPYTFLPVIPRDTVPPDSEFRDRAPVGHDRLRGDHFTGTIRVTLTTVTPLLIPDAARASENVDGHKTFPVRLGSGGKPYLAPTAVKGMLRAAYEAITNSCLGVFPRHEDRLGFRTAARDSLRVIPARVEGSPTTLQLMLYPGDSQIDPPRGPDGPMYAAWLPMYGSFRKNWGVLAAHGQHVWAFITLWAHGPFDFWNVVELQPGDGFAPTHTPADTRRPWKNARPRGEPGRWVNGYVCITNQNIDSKHDERVFFSTRSTNPVLSLPSTVRDEWANLIRDYQAIHADEIRQGQTGPPALTRSVWSRHVTGGNEETELAHGTLCHAVVEPDIEGTLRVVRLYPVMISRKLFDKSPLQSLHGSLHPATEYGKLSPADRVFGWVHQKGKGGYRGQLRVGPVTLTSPLEGAIREFHEPGLPLAILGQPKPQQVRFYLGDANGGAQSAGQTKEHAGYDGTKRLRGRKVYPHHAKLADDHWQPDGALTTSDPNVFREYLRHPKSEKQRDNQNRSVLGWVNPGTTFTFDLHVTNLSKVELGALVWLLTLPENHFHRLGLGKPLGFGSVRLEIDYAKTRVNDGEAWKRFYGALGNEQPNCNDLDGAKDEFVTELCRAFPPDADRILKSFTVAAAGVLNLPVRYPRVGQPGQPVAPNPAGEGYEWFVANDAGQQLTLPNLTDDPGLPNDVRGSGRR